MKKDYKPEYPTQQSEYEHRESLPEYWAEKNLGSMGRMVGGSKSIYRHDNPKNLVIFNANVLTEEDGKIWHGDLDITEDFIDLQRLSTKLGKKIYVLRESAARFGKVPNIKEEFEVMFDGEEISFLEQKYFYLEVDGKGRKVPYAKTETELVAEAKKEGSYKEFEYTYKKEDYQETVKLPDLSKYKVTLKEDPLSFYQKELIDLIGREKAERIHLDIHVTKKYYDQLKGLVEKFAKKKFPYMHPAKLKQSVDWTMIDMAPSCFMTDQEWAKDDFVGYILKK